MRCKTHPNIVEPHPARDRERGHRRGDEEPKVDEERPPNSLSLCVWVYLVCVC